MLTRKQIAEQELAAIDESFAWDIGYGMCLRACTINTNPYSAKTLRAAWKDGFSYCARTRSNQEK